MTDHEIYEVFCALAATGQLGESEAAIFDDHCLACAACRTRLRDLVFVGARLQLEAVSRAVEAPMPAGSLERFRARAVREGIAPSPDRVRPVRSSVLAPVAAVFLVFATCAFWMSGRRDAETIAISSAESPVTRQSLLAAETAPAPTARPEKPFHKPLVRHAPSHSPSTESPELPVPRFAQAALATYIFSGPQASFPRSYPPLSRFQISRLSQLSSPGDLNTRSLTGIAAPERPIDIASAGSTVDFMANIRQLRFQMPTAQ